MYCSEYKQRPKDLYDNNKEKREKINIIEQKIKNYYQNNHLYPIKSCAFINPTQYFNYDVGYACGIGYYAYQEDDRSNLRYSESIETENLFVTEFIKMLGEIHN